METEAILAKLRRLRCRSDYGMWLFLAALDGLAGSPGPETAPAVMGLRCLWRSDGQGGWPAGTAACPRCGHRAQPRMRRSRAHG